jgi:hAT family C-terminal dimerisation region
MDFNIDTCSSPLQWWIKHDSKYFPYPHLRSVALEILTVQVSCIPSEKTTSALNRVFSDKNCSLSKDNLNRLFVLNSMPLTFWDVYVGAHLDVMQKRSCSG